MSTSAAAAARTTSSPDPERGLIISHGILLAVVTLLIGPTLGVFFYLGDSVTLRWKLTYNAWLSLMGNMISGVIMGIVVGVRKEINFTTTPHLTLGILLFALTLILASTPFLPARLTRNDLTRYGFSTKKVLSLIAGVVWILATCNIMLGVHLSREPRKIYVIYGSLIGVSFFVFLVVTLWLMRKASITRRREASRARDIVE